MKKSFAFLLLCCFFFSGCKSSFSAIEYRDVEKVIIWTHESEREASSNEISSIIQLYNSAEYDGKATGEGGTPNFGVIIVLKNENEVLINDFYGKVEVITKSQAFHLKSQDLYETIKEASSLSSPVDRPAVGNS